MATRSLDALLLEKKKAKKKIIQTYRLPSDTKLICVLSMSDIQVRDFLVDGLESLGIACLLVSDMPGKYGKYTHSIGRLEKDHLYGADFFIHDNQTKNLDVLKLLSHGIVPIMPEKNNFQSLLRPFNPIAFSGNSFLYPKNDKYAIFASTVSLMENMKFPADYKILLKNVCSATY